MNLSQHNGDVYGFDSTWDQDRQVLVRDAGTETSTNQVEKTDFSQQTLEKNDIGVSSYGYNENILN